jgi:membrane protein
MESVTERGAPQPPRSLHGALQYLPVKRALHLPILLKRAFSAAIVHDCANVAQSAAYSSIVALFPALIVAAAAIGYLPDTGPIHAELLSVFNRIFPSEISRLLEGYFVSTPNTPARGVLVALFLSISGASGVIITFMEGLRRARGLPADCWTFWQRRRRAYALVPLSLLPLAIASILVVFGHVITTWIALHVPPAVHAPVYFAAVLIRWTVSLTASVGLIALLYHLGTPERQPWPRTLPGAIMATGTWFLTTLGFGWYVTRFANYSQVYGSLGAGIALLFWLYIVSFSVLCGAEFNAQFYPALNPSQSSDRDDSPPHCQTPA